MKLKFLDRFEFPVLLAGLLIAAGMLGLRRTGRRWPATPRRMRSTRRSCWPSARLAIPPIPIGPAWFEEAVRDVTSLGGTAVLIYVTATW